MYVFVCSPVELKDQVMLRLKLLEALMDMSKFLLAWKQPNNTIFTLSFQSTLVKSDRRIR